MHRFPIIRLSLFTLALAVVGGCGGSSPTPTAPSATTPTATTPTTTPPTTTTPTPTPPTSSVQACKLTNPFATGVGFGFPRSTARLKASGDVRITVLFVDFSDAVSTRTPEAVFGLIASSHAYFRTVSYGAMNVTYEPSYTWLRMSKPSTAYGWSALTFALHHAYIQEAINLAGTSVDFSNADGFVIMANPDATALRNGPAYTANRGSGVNARGRILDNGITSGNDLLNWGYYWANHELGHNLTLPDLYHSSGPQHRSVGMFSLMGNTAGRAFELFGFERWSLGWIADDQVVCAGSGETRATLSPVARPGGTKMLIVPLSSTSAIVVESRRIESHDAGFTPGALVYFVNTAVRSLEGPIRVLPINDADLTKGSAPLTAGRSLTHEGVTVTVVSSDGSGDVVTVSRP